ncbi:MAG: hypothetical protein G01um101416_495 [Microgenomates group bacterium Gr01-1014_16]|nr:MAG: hypothetical protein G01um101416_495 [Microgenomates group bacterium Gr01-1014_16]
MDGITHTFNIDLDYICNFDSVKTENNVSPQWRDSNMGLMLRPRRRFVVEAGSPMFGIIKL